MSDEEWTDGPHGGGRLVDLYRRIRPHLGLALFTSALVLTGIGVVLAYRAERSHEETVQGVLSDYGQVVAFNYARTWTDILDDALNATLEVARSTAYRGATTQECVETLLAAREELCGCVLLTGPWAFHIDYGGPEPELLFGGDPPDEMDQSTLASEVLGRLRGGEGALSRGVIWVEIQEEPTAIAYQALENVFQDTVAYGVVIDPARLQETFERAFDSGVLLPPALASGHANAELVEVVLERPDGTVIFSRPPAATLDHEATLIDGDRFGVGAVRASILPERAEQLVIGGLPRSRIPFLLLVFGLAGALAIAAVVQLRRERALARLRQDFVASVSHELRTPLAQIRLFVETLKLGRARTDEQRDWSLDNIDRETLRLVRLVENVLAFDRAERGARLAELRPLDLADEAAEAAADFRPLITEDRASIEVDTPAGLTVLGDSDALRQVLTNLLDNAVKYGPKGQTIRVGGVRRGKRTRLWVDDEGAGIPVPDRERVFAPYKRGSEAVGGAVAGSGIGLAVVRQIVKAHQGSVRVEDTPGGGARFVLEFPTLLTAQAPASSRSFEPSEPSLADEGAFSDRAGGVA